MRNVRLVALLAAGVVAACGKSSTAVTTTGTVVVHVDVAGTSQDTSFIISVDGSYNYGVTAGADQSFQVDALAHSITLGGVASNCEVTGTNPQIIQIAPGSTQTLTFTVSCSTNGDVAVTIATTGQNEDDQYTLTFNDTFYTVPVGPRQTLTVSLPVDTYVVQLKDVAANCAVQGDNPVSVDVVGDSLTTARFDIACTAP